MKKTIRNISVFAMVLALAITLAACFGDKSGCTHTYKWEGNAEKHWQVCTLCDKKTEESAHVLDEAFFCETCASEVYRYEEGTFLTYYNDHDDAVLWVEYDAEGNVLYKTVYEYLYDEDGNMTYEKDITNGAVSYECWYHMVDGESLPQKAVSYYEEGGKCVSEYTDYGLADKEYIYDADENLTEEYVYENVQTDDGYWTRVSYVCTKSDGTKSYVRFDERDEIVEQIEYNADGEITDKLSWEFTYGEDGRP